MLNFSRRPDFWCVTLLLAITIPMFFVGIDWGLPNHYSYAPDAISPIESLDALNSYVIRESGWCKKYPLGHYLLTGVMYQPYLAYLDFMGRGKPFRDAIDRILATDQANFENHFQFLQQFVAFRPRMTNLLLMGAALSALMGVASVLLVYLIGKELSTRLAGLGAAILAAAYGPTVYHAHTMNVDIPYVFWLMLTFWLLLRALVRGKTRWFVLCGIAGAMAFATKDQSYGVLAAVPFLLMFTWRRPGVLIRGLEPRAAFPWRQVMFALLAFVTVYCVVNNVFWNWHGFKEHMHTITTVGVEPYREVDSKTASGQLDLLGRTGAAINETVPWQVLVLLGAGIAVGLVLRPGPTLFCLLPAITYYASYIAVVGYCYARFLLPIVFFAALPAGRLLSDLRRVPGKLRFAGGAVGILCLVVAVNNGIEVVRLFLDDPRDQATAWMQEHLTPNDRVLVMSQMTFTAPAIPDRVPFKVVSPQSLPPFLSEKEKARFITDVVEQFNPTCFATCVFGLPPGPAMKELEGRPVEETIDFMPPAAAEALQKVIRVSPQVRIYRVRPKS